MFKTRQKRNPIVGVVKPAAMAVGTRVLAVTAGGTKLVTLKVAQTAEEAKDYELVYNREV